MVLAGGPYKEEIVLEGLFGGFNGIRFCPYTITDQCVTDPSDVFGFNLDFKSVCLARFDVSIIELPTPTTRLGAVARGDELAFAVFFRFCRCAWFNRPGCDGFKVQGVPPFICCRICYLYLLMISSNFPDAFKS